MKRVVSIDSVVLDYKCFISSEFDVDDYLGKSSIAIDGSSVVFIQAKGSMTKVVSIYSKDSGWIHKDTKDSLIDTVDNLAKIVTFDDSSQDTYHYDFTQIPLEFTPLYEGSLWYTIKINLVKG